MSVTASALDDRESALQGRIDVAAQMLKNEPMFGGRSDAERRDTVRFVVGNLLFVLLHEVGHVQIHEMGLPVLGREEDAADGYASIMMLAMRTSSPNVFSRRPRRGGSTAIAVTGWSTRPGLR
jgi:hypothetical protein